MVTCGIICEYNPFHNGHAYQIAEIRRRLGEDTGIICVMSGDFVQRGEAAAFRKHDRARTAVLGGADLVLELPLPWSIASAERFARGAVGLLGATGVVTHLCFGSESGDLESLLQTADTLLRPDMDELIRSKLETGLSYAVARQSALEQISGAAAPQLSNPNDILALEYLKAIRTQGLELQPLCIQRIGAAHDSQRDELYPSASALRGKLRAGEDISPWLPHDCADALAAGDGPVSASAVETAILSRLRFLPEAAFAALPDAGEGLHHRLFLAARTEARLEAIVERVSSKRYPKSRIRRMCLCAALHVHAGDSAGVPPYLRVLAADRRGQALLRKMHRSCTLPLITKPAAARGLPENALRIFELGADASDLLCLGYADPEAAAGGRDWKTSPFIAK